MARVHRRIYAPSGIRDLAGCEAAEDQQLISDCLLLEGPANLSGEAVGPGDPPLFLATWEHVRGPFSSDAASSPHLVRARLDAEVIAGCWDPCLERIFAHVQLHSELDRNLIGIWQNEVVPSRLLDYYQRCWGCGKTSMEEIQDLTLSAPQTTAPGMLEFLSTEVKMSREESSDDSEETLSEGRNELFVGTEEEGLSQSLFAPSVGEQDEVAADACACSDHPCVSHGSASGKSEDSFSSSANPSEKQEAWEIGSTGCRCACATPPSAGTPATNKSPLGGSVMDQTHGSRAQTSCASPSLAPHVERSIQTSSLVFRLADSAESMVIAEYPEGRHCRAAGASVQQQPPLGAGAYQRAHLHGRHSLADPARWHVFSAGEPSSGTTLHFKHGDPADDGDQLPPLRRCGVAAHLCGCSDHGEQRNQEEVGLVPDTYGLEGEQARLVIGHPDMQSLKGSLYPASHSLSRSTTSSSLAGAVDTSEPCRAEASSLCSESESERATLTCSEVWRRTQTASKDQPITGNKRAVCKSVSERCVAGRSYVQQLSSTFDGLRAGDLDSGKWVDCCPCPEPGPPDSSIVAYPRLELPCPACGLEGDVTSSGPSPSSCEPSDVCAVGSVVPSLSSGPSSRASGGGRIAPEREAPMQVAASLERPQCGCRPESGLEQLRRGLRSESCSAQNSQGELEAAGAAQTAGCLARPFSDMLQATCECAGQVGDELAARLPLNNHTERASIQTPQGDPLTGCNGDSLFRNSGADRASSVPVFGPVPSSTLRAALTRCTLDSQQRHPTDNGELVGGLECSKGRTHTSDSSGTTISCTTQRLKRHLEDEVECDSVWPVKKASRDPGERKSGRNDGRVLPRTLGVAGDATWPAECGGVKSPSSSSVYQVSDDTGAQGASESNLRWHEGFTLPLGKDGRGELIKRMRSVHKADRDFCRFTLESMGVDFKRLAHATVEELWKIAHSWGLFSYAVKLSRKYGKTATNPSRRKTIHPLRVDRSARFCM